MILLRLIILSAVLIAANVDAATRYMATSASGGSDSYTCLESTDPSMPKLTFKGTSNNGAKSCMSPGDILAVLPGTYTGIENQLDLTGMTGTSLLPYRIVASSGVGTAVFMPVESGSPVQSCRTFITNSTTQFITVEGIKLLRSNCTFYVTGDRFINTVNITLKDLEVTDGYYNGLYIEGGSNLTIDGGSFHDVHSTCVEGTRANAIYAHHGYTNLTIKNVKFYGWPGGLQFYPGPYTGVTLLNNDVHDNNWCTTQTNGAVIFLANSGSVSGVVVSGNLIYHNGYANGTSTGGVGGGIRHGGSFSITGSVFENNTIYDNKTKTGSTNGYGINLETGSVNAIVRNNIITANMVGSVRDAGTGSTLSFNACTSAESCGSTGKVTLSPDIGACVVDASQGDFRLNEATTPCHNSGTTATSRACNGTCDVGAYESFTFSSGSVTGTTAEVLLGMGLFTPAIVTADGWTLNCTPSPTACPSASVSSGTLKSGTNTTAAIGWSGGACSSGQTWTVSYGSGSTTDSVPFTNKQVLSSFTTQPLTNNCTGTGGGSPPGTPYILYEFDDNLSDTSGNNLHITTSNGTSFVNAKFFRGLKTDSGEDDYAEIPYFSGVNPTTQSLTIAGGVYIDPADVCSLKAVGGTPAGVSQYFHLYYSGCNWKMLVQDSTAVATEFSVQSGWNHVCVNFNAATDTSTLHINGVAGAVSTASVQTYTSFIFAGNFRIGRFSGSSLAAGPNHIYDRWVVYQSVEDCGGIYENFNPPSTPYTGVIDIVQGRVYMAKSYAGSPIPIGLLSTNTTLPLGAAFATAFQAKCSNAGDCSPVGQRPYYTCAACPSAGSELPVPDSASADGIEFWGTVSETGLLTGAHGANLSGGETHVNGGTHLTSDSITVVDLCQDCSTTERWIFRIKTTAPSNAVYCIFPKEQSGIDFDSYSPAAGICVSVGQANADSGP